MNIGVSEISPRAIQIHAEEKYQNGFCCSESIISTIYDDLKLDVPEEIIALASGMGAGIGSSGCICGALNSSVMIIGMFFGRSKAGDSKFSKCMKLSAEIHDWFKQNNKKNATCCKVLTRGFDKSNGEHKNQCIYFAGLCAWKLAEILSRELNIKNTDDIKEPIPFRNINTSNVQNYHIKK